MIVFEQIDFDNYLLVIFPKVERAIFSTLLDLHKISSNSPILHWHTELSTFNLDFFLQAI